jgi:four helix bundle protein
VLAREALAEHSKPLGPRTFRFACDVVRVCSGLVWAGGIERTIGQQLLRAATSIGANYEESQAASSRRDFLARQEVALRECRETLYWLRLLTACSLGPKTPLERLGTEATELVAILTASTRTAKNNLRRQP